MSGPNCLGCTHAFTVRAEKKDGELLRAECWYNPPTPFIMGMGPGGVPNIVSTFAPVGENMCCSQWKEGFPRVMVAEIQRVQPATAIDLPPGARRDN